MELDIVIEDERWHGMDVEALSRRAAMAALDHLGISSVGEIVLLVCDDRRIAELNGAFREKAVPTNILSWPSVERSSPVAGQAPNPPAAGEPLGDLALAFETVEKEARAAGIPVQNHVMHLVVHGVLHLLGYDHVRDADGDLMESLETAILAHLGVPDPYGKADGTENDTGKD